MIHLNIHIREQLATSTFSMGK